MELDDLKLALRNLDRRLEQQSSLNLLIYKERKLDQTRASLRPLVWGHAGQVALGLLLIFMVVPFWWEHRDNSHLLIAGVMLHIYAVLMIALGGRVLALIYTLNVAAPVLVIQKQLARLRRSYVTTSLIVGVPWWVLWVPLVMVMTGFDLVGDAPAAWFISNVVIGVAGILGTLWFHRALWFPADAERARKLEEGAAGSSLQRAQGFLDEIAQFEKE